MPTPDPLEARIAARQQAAAQRAERIVARLPEAAARLRRRGARRVVLFGSLADNQRIHQESDVDICVEGLDDSARGEAVMELESLLDASVDLVSWERATETLRRRIAHDGKDLEP